MVSSRAVYGEKDDERHLPEYRHSPADGFKLDDIVTKLNRRQILKNTASGILMGLILPLFGNLAGQSVSITELMYNPLDDNGTSGSDLEFIEIKNVSDSPIDLSLAAFTDGVEFTFGPNSIMPAGEYWVLVSDFTAFPARYPGVAVKGEYGGQLSNGGETVELRDRNGLVLETVEYEDASPWPEEADGEGKSLVKRDEATIPDSPANASAWRASFDIHGSPGREDPTPPAPNIFVNEVLAHTDLPQLDALEIYNPGSEAADISGWYLSDDLSDPKKYRIPETTIIPAGGYLFFTETEFAAEAQGDAGFRFSSHGESAWLISAHPDGSLTGYTHGFEFGASASGVSFGRYLDSRGMEIIVASETVTLGAENSPPLIGPVIINEILYRQGDNGIEFVEIINLSSEAIPLFDPDNPGNTWKIDGIGFDFPTGAIIQPQQCILITNVEPETFRNAYGAYFGVPLFGPFAGGINNSGERITLERPGSPEMITGEEIFVPYIEVDSVRYENQQPWPVTDTGSSIEKMGRGLFGQEPENWQVSRTRGGSPGIAQDLDYSTWQRLHFSTEEINTSTRVGLEGDFNGDGLQNIWEYAFGLDPRIHHSGANASSLLVEDLGNEYLAIQFRKQTYSEDLIYQLQESNDLQKWSDTTNPIQVLKSDNGDGTELIVLRGVIPIAPTEKWFQRLKISLIGPEPNS